MVLATCPVVDQSASIIRQNMAKIKLLTVAGPLLCHPEQTHRIVRLLPNRHSWGIERPLVMLAVHSDDEKAAAERFQSGAFVIWRDTSLFDKRATTKRLAMLSTCFASSSTQPLTHSLPKGRASISHDAVAKGSRTSSAHFWGALEQPAANGRGPWCGMRTVLLSKAS